MLSYWDRWIAACDRAGQALPPTGYFLGRWGELAVAGGFFSIVLLLLVRGLGLGRRLQRLRKAMVASAYEVLLCRRHPRHVLLAEGKLIWTNFKTFVVLAPIVLCGGILFASMAGTLANRYQCASGTVGEDVVIHSQLEKDDAVKAGEHPTPGPDDGLAVTAFVRNRVTQKAWIRLTASRAGTFTLNGPAGSSGGPVLNIGRPEFPAQPRQRSLGVSYHIGYPLRKWPGGQKGWMLCFFGMSLVLAWPLSRVLRVRL